LRQIWALSGVSHVRHTRHDADQRDDPRLDAADAPVLSHSHAGEVEGIITRTIRRRARRGCGHGDVRKAMRMGTPQKWMGMLVILAVLLVGSAGPGDAWKGGHGGGGHGGKWHGGHGGKWHGGHRWHGGHGWGGPRVGIGIGIGPFWGPYWGPYWRPYWGPYWGGYWRRYAYGYPYAYPPVVTVPSTQLYVQPSAPAAAQPPPPAYWYYCDQARGYYPYVQQCPGGWRAVAPTPP
jgi:hypothetical protein